MNTTKHILITVILISLMCGLFGPSATSRQACTSQLIIMDNSAGSNGTSITAALLNSSTFGLASPNVWSIVNGTSPNAAYFAFSNSPAAKAMGGTFPTLCSTPWPGNTAVVNSSKTMDNIFQSGSMLFPSTAADVVVDGFWIYLDLAATPIDVNMDVANLKSPNAGSNPNFLNTYVQTGSGSIYLGLENPGYTSERTLVGVIVTGTWYYVTRQYSAIASKGMRMRIFASDLTTVVANLPSTNDESRFPTSTYQKVADHSQFGHYAVHAANDDQQTKHIVFGPHVWCWTGTCTFPDSVMPSLDSTPPTPGNSGTITTASITSSALTLNWTAATDDVSAQSTLAYTVYRSASNNISSVANMLANGTVIMASTVNVATYAVTGLNPATTYYFNVKVCDEHANCGPYTTVNATTTDLTPPSYGTGLKRIGR